MTYTPGYVSDFLNVPGSTLRRWAVRFEKYLNPQPPEAGRHRVYSAQDLETFRTIRDLTSKGQSLKTIENTLQVIPPGAFASDHEEPASPKQDQAAQGEPGPGSALMVMGFSRELGNHDAQLKRSRIKLTCKMIAWPRLLNSWLCPGIKDLASVRP